MVRTVCPCILRYSSRSTYKAFGCNVCGSKTSWGLTAVYDQPRRSILSYVRITIICIEGCLNAYDLIEAFRSTKSSWPSADDEYIDGAVEEEQRVSLYFKIL